MSDPSHKVEGEPVAIRQWRRIMDVPNAVCVSEHIWKEGMWLDHDGTDEQWKSWGSRKSFELRILYTRPSTDERLREALKDIASAEFSVQQTAGKSAIHRLRDIARKALDGTQEGDG